jgi:hypothetical protein
MLHLNRIRGTSSSVVVVLIPLFARQPDIRPNFKELIALLKVGSLNLFNVPPIEMARRMNPCNHNNEEVVIFDGALKLKFTVRNTWSKFGLLVLHHAGLVPCVAEPEQVSSILP